MRSIRNFTFRSTRSNIESKNKEINTIEHDTSVQTGDQSSDLCSNIFLILNEASKITTDSVNHSDMELKRKNKIVKLERRLSNLSRLIRELEEKELSLDEMRYSDLYQVESNLKKQAYDVSDSFENSLSYLIHCSDLYKTC